MELPGVDAAGREVMTAATAVKNEFVRAEATITALMTEWRGVTAASFGSEWDTIHSEGLACTERLHNLGEFLRTAASAFNEIETDVVAAFRHTT
ncbi:WXG100 family type VII secretion target [Nocardia transvalensis]|uniref:WXG100 family type VII secretion target n=1 Tax=Nocardia transvalensis TaxID=37333 RepID=UPI001E5A895E|nr:WXG100 family type VII secretion target [Nocardia transvalensis]